jgi:branched-chain amino acid transport system ATP-binding protein
VLTLSQVNVRISGIDILRDVSMDVPDGSFVALVGRNGAGKTTLMRSIMNLVPIASGEIRIDGKSSSRSPAFSHARNGVGYMPEDRRLVPDWTVEQNIMLPAWASKRADTGTKIAQIYDLMPEVAQFRSRKALQLSGGQQKLVALARALMASERLLILDEPFEGVAPALVHRLIEILSRMRYGKHLSVLVSESDAVHSAGLVDRSYTIERGRLRASA